MKLKVKAEVWIWDLKVEIWRRNLKFEAEIWSWNERANVEVGICGWNSKLKFEAEIRSWYMNLEKLFLN